VSSSRDAVTELDMGFTVEEVTDGVARLLTRLGADAADIPSRNGVCFRGPRDVTVDIGPMPEERIKYPVLFPRTLLTLRGDPVAVESLRREILLAFLRVGG
jgi:hypothetical protein